MNFEEFLNNYLLSIISIVVISIQAVILFIHLLKEKKLLIKIKFYWEAQKRSWAISLFIYEKFKNEIHAAAANDFKLREMIKEIEENKNIRKIENQIEEAKLKLKQLEEDKKNNI